MLYPTELRTHFASFLDAQVQNPMSKVFHALPFGLWPLGLGLFRQAAILLTAGPAVKNSSDFIT